MAIRPGGPLGDYQSHVEYANERLKGQQNPSQQSASRPAPQEPQETPKQKQGDVEQSILSENERNAARNAVERASKLGQGQQQSQSEAKQAKLQEMATALAPKENAAGQFPQQQRNPSERGS